MDLKWAEEHWAPLRGLFIVNRNFPIKARLTDKSARYEKAQKDFLFQKDVRDVLPNFNNTVKKNK